MAKTTIDDCLEHCSNHFELVAGVVDRARKIISGHTPSIGEDNDKAIVLALREIAQGKHEVDFKGMVLQNLQASQPSSTTPNDTDIREITFPDQLSPGTTS